MLAVAGPRADDDSGCQHEERRGGKKAKYALIHFSLSVWFLDSRCWTIRTTAGQGSNWNVEWRPCNRSTARRSGRTETASPASFYYQRYAHPTGVEAERALGELEGGEALLFPSGSGAITALVLAELGPGQTIALAEGAGYGTGAALPHTRALGPAVSSSSTRPARRRLAPTSSGSRRLRIRS